MQDQIHPKKDILGTKPKKAIVKFEISSLEYPFVHGVISNKVLSSFGIKFPSPPKKNLGSYFRKIKGPSTLFWETAKPFSQFWLIVGYNVNILGHSSS